MLLHPPIAIMAPLSTITVRDTLPAFDIVRECRFAGGSTPANAAQWEREGRLFQRNASRWRMA